MKTVGPFQRDTSNHCLWRADERAPLTPKVFDVLRYLVERSGQLVSQEELLGALWPETYVNPEGIRKYILEVRRVLGDPADKPAFIETLPKRGYQFIAPVIDDSRSARLNARKNESEAWMWVLGEAWLRLLCYDFEGVRRVAEITMSSDVESHAIWTRTATRMSAGYHEIAKGNYEKAWELFAQVRDYDITPKFFLHWHWRMHAQLGATEARLSGGDIQSARREADAFLESALSVADLNLRAFAWEINSRVATAEGNWRTARATIENALAIVDKFEIPIAGWKVHSTTADLYEGEGDHARANEHRARAHELIMKIADSFEAGEPLRESFLIAPPIRRVFANATSA